MLKFLNGSLLKELKDVNPLINFVSDLYFDGMDGL